MTDRQVIGYGKEGAGKSFLTKTVSRCFSCGTEKNKATKILPVLLISRIPAQAHLKGSCVFVRRACVNIICYPRV